MEHATPPRWRVVVTRAPDQAQTFAVQLERRGAVPVFFPTLTIAEDQEGALTTAVAHLHDYDAVVLGSVNAVKYFGQALERQGEVCEGVVGCVGKKTADALQSERWNSRFRGHRIVPSVFRAEALGEALLAHFEKQGGIEGRRILYPRAPQGRTILQQELRRHGAQVDDVPAYQIACQAYPAEMKERLTGVDAYTFLSGKTLCCFLSGLGEEEARTRLADSIVAVIGPVAKAEADRLGVRVDVVAAEATVEALAEAVVTRLATSARRAAERISGS